jgi:cytidyltransferase-like protein
MFTVIADGVIMAVLTGDMIVAKMASRDLHPLVPILLMLSIFDNFLCFAGALYYYCVVLYEISMHLRIPIFGVKRVVFINGVFDLFHRAHLRLVKAAAAEGTYLIVGVLSEEDVLTYKPKLPAMTFQQRFDALKDCAYVDEVIQSPLYIRGEEGDRFLEKHKIDLIVCSSEYDDPTDEYYESSRRQGKLHILERMDGISTSKLKNQVFERCKDEDKND